MSPETILINLTCDNLDFLEEINGNRVSKMNYR